MMPHALPAAGPARMAALASYGEVPLQVVQMWALVRDTQVDAVSGTSRTIIDWTVFRELYDAEHPATEGIERADAIEWLRLCEREANSNPATWSELTGWAEE